MSNIGQAALTIVGFAVGGFFGYPYLGVVLGSLAGQALFPTKLPGVSGPRLTDTNTTSAQVGAPVMEVYGTDCVPGNVIYLSAVREVSHTEEVGGKGGPEQSQTSYTYYQTIALGLCRGEKGGIRRVWENGKLVFDLRAGLIYKDAAHTTLETSAEMADRINASIDYAEKFVLYFGTEEQLPDPTLEAALGVGNVPGFHGLMYIVYPDRQLQQDQGLRHPTFKFEIFPAAAERIDGQDPTVYLHSDGTVADPGLGGGGGGGGETDPPNLLILVAPALAENQDTLLRSDDGITWTSEPLLNRQSRWAGGGWSLDRREFAVAASSNYGGVGMIATLADPYETWLDRNGDVGSGTRDWRDIAWAPSLGLYCAIGPGSVTALTSPDGVTWTPANVGQTGFARLVWAPGLALFIAVKNDGNQGILTSPDGMTWTLRNGPGGGSPQGASCIAWSPELGLLVVKGARTMTSPNGLAWTFRTDASGGGYGVAWSAPLGLFAAVGSDQISTSPDGINWTARTRPVPNIVWVGLAWSPVLALFVACGRNFSATNQAIMTSPDGINWTARTVPTLAGDQEPFYVIASTE